MILIAINIIIALFAALVLLAGVNKCLVKKYMEGMDWLILSWLLLVFLNSIHRIFSHV